MATESTFDRVLKVLVAIICLPLLPFWFCFVYLQRLLESPENDLPEADESTSDEDSDKIQIMRRHEQHTRYAKRPHQHRLDKSPYPIPMGHQARKSTLYSGNTESSDDESIKESSEKYLGKEPVGMKGRDRERHRSSDRKRDSRKGKHPHRKEYSISVEQEGRHPKEAEHISFDAKRGKQPHETRHAQSSPMKGVHPKERDHFDSMSIRGNLPKESEDIDTVSVEERSLLETENPFVERSDDTGKEEVDIPFNLPRLAFDFKERNEKGEVVEEFLVDRTAKVEHEGKARKKGQKGTSEKKQVSIEDKGATDGQQYKLKEIKDDMYNLKSIKMDLSEFEALDTYACKIPPRSTVQKLVKELLVYASTDLERVRAIWIWICCHIEYDVKGFHNKDTKHNSPTDVLKSGKAVCAGYSGLFCEMCSLAGIQCTIIEGYSKGYNYDVGKKFTGEADHAWNAVFLDGKWHLLDSTWGAGHVNETCSKFTFKYVEFYFLTHPTLFINNHFPNDETWQLISPKIPLKIFENMVFRTGEFYDIGLTYIHPEVQVVSTVNGRVIINVEGLYPTYFIFNLDGKKDCGILTITKYGMKLEVLPQKAGEFRLKIYAKLFDSKEETYSFICGYLVKCDFIEENFKLPKVFHNPLGPSWITENKGLLKPSHPEPIIYCDDGNCNIRFMLNRDLSFTSKLSCDEVKLSEEVMRNHVFKTQQGNWVEFQIHLPAAGLYVFAIFSKDKAKRSPTHDHVCEYFIFCRDKNVHWPSFPKVFSSWTDGCELIEPLSGILPRNEMVTFKLKIPHVRKVQVYGKSPCPLTMSNDGYWEGRCYTQDSKFLSVGVSDKMFDTKFTFALQYEIEGS